MLQDQSRVVRLPVNVYELLSKINKVANHLNAQPDRQKSASYAEIGEIAL
jgi:DNA-directed RNA polymerase sigma subunit (sigma70/sigma32)